MMEICFTISKMVVNGVRVEEEEEEEEEFDGL